MPNELPKTGKVRFAAGWIVSAVLAALLTASAAVTAASSEFSNPRVLSDDIQGGRSVYPADLDGDGDIDVLAASFRDTTVGWYENQGNGGFSARHVIETDAQGAWSTHAADLDGDGDLDVLSASYMDDTVAWYENQGGGAFSARHALATDADGAASVHAADLDGDGDLDVLSASAFDDTVGWYENQGGGTFSTRVAIAADADGAISVHAADLDGDGDLDVLSASQIDNTVGWYENQGGGAFAARLALATDALSAQSAYAADLDGDGDLDVLSASYTDDTVAWYENQGGGAFSMRRAIAADADGAVSVHAADLDGDGDLDVLSASALDDRIAWYENQGGGAFSFGGEFDARADAAWDVHAADLDGDGDLDVLAAAGATFSWYENVDAPTAAPRGVEVTTRPGYITVSWEPLGLTESGGAPETLRYVVTATPAPDGAGVSCTVAAPASECTIEVQPGESYSVSLFAENDAGTGPEWEANAPAEVPWGFSDARDIGASVRGASAVYAADLDGDGDADVLFASYLDDTVGWFDNLGGDTFSGKLTIATGVDGAEAVDAADLDNDGDLDVLSASSNDDTIAWHENMGGGAFRSHTIATDAILARDVHAADLNGDGYIDVLSASEHDNRIAGYVNLHDGTFSAALDIAADAYGAQAVHAADVDGDGDLDVLSASALDDTVAWYENLGSLAFSERRVIDPDADGAIDVYAADLTGDGTVDVLSASSWDDRIAWYSNYMGDGTFDGSTIDFDAAGAWDVYAADLDGDGDSDVLSASRGDDRIAWYENTLADDDSPYFSGQPYIATDAEGAESVYAADLDGDGDLDVLSASFHGNTIAWYENAGSPTAPTAAPDGVDAVAGPGRIEVEWQPLSGSSERGRDPEIRYVATATPVGGGARLSCTVEEPATTCTIQVRSLVAHSVTVRAENGAGAGPSSGDGAVAPPTVTPEWGFSGALALDDAALGALSAHAADLDGDGDLDVLAGSFNNWIAWYENGGDGTFAARRTIADDFRGRVWSVHAANLDGDGDLDVIAPLEVDDTIAWYENDGAGGFTANPAIAADAEGARGVYAADLDGDGDPDVLSASFDNDTIAWYENDGAGGFTANPAIAADADGAHAVHAADLDGDGDLDVLSTSINGRTIAWYENDGGGGFSSGRVIATDAPGATSVHAADLDGDGDLDVLSKSSGNDPDRIAWYENDGAGAFTAREITADARGAFDSHAADLDGDGDLDVLSASLVDDTIRWFENQGGGNFSAWPAIWTGADQATSVFAADLDGDGDLDVLSASYGDNTVAWYKNLFGQGDDHGNAPESATPVTALPAVLHGALESGGDRDVFRVAVASGTLRVYSTGSTDTFGTLMDADGAELARNDDNGAGRNFLIELDVAAGTHYVEVRGYSNATTGPYTLSIELVVGSQPSFAAGSGPADQSYTVGTAIDALTLPEAGGGDGALTYSLSPAVPGLSFNATTRRLTGTPTAAGAYDMTYRVRDTDGDTDSLTFTITVTNPAQVDDYTPLEGLRVSAGRLQYGFFSAGGCIPLSNTTINGVTYTVHGSKWQRRDSANSAWEDVPGTEQQGRLCAYNPTSAGEYRLVGEVSVNGVRGRYSSENTIIVN